MVNATKAQLSSFTKMKTMRSITTIYLLGLITVGAFAQEVPIPPPVPEIKVQQEPITEFPDVEPQFPGGEEAMQHFFVNTLQYPETSVENNEQGKVYVEFVVEVDGNITNIRILRGVSRDLDREAKRIIRAMPQWKPGEKDGKKVRTRMRLPIKFTLR